MPPNEHGTTSAEQSAADASGSQSHTQSEAEGGSNLPPLTSAEKSGLMDRLGIPDVVSKGMQEEAPEEGAAAEGEAINDADQSEEQPQGEAEENAGEGEGEADGEAEAEGSEEEEGNEEGDEGEAEKGTPDVKKLERRNYKLRKRAQGAERERDELKTQLAETAAKLEKATPINVVPTQNDPLAHVMDLDALEKEKIQFRNLRDMARAKPQGWVANEGTDNETVVTPEQAAQYLSYAEDVLTDHFPRKEKEITEVRPVSEKNARQILPDMFKAGTEDHTAARAVWRAFPMLAALPNRDVMTAVLLRGYKAISADAVATNGNGKLKVPAAILKAHDDKGKVILQKQRPPGRSTQAPSPKATDMANVVSAIAKGGGREALAEGLKALRQAEGPKGRSPAPV